MVKIKANHKVTQREILKYHICEHHKVGYEALEKLCEKQQKTLRVLGGVMHTATILAIRMTNMIALLVTLTSGKYL